MEWQIREEESKLKVLSDWERSGGEKKEVAGSEATWQKKNEKLRGKRK